MALKTFVVLLLQVTAHYMTNTQRLKGDFPAVQLYKAAIPYLNALSSLFFPVWAANAKAFQKDGFARLLATERQLTKTSQPMSLQIFCISMRVFAAKEGQQTEGMQIDMHAQQRQKMAISRIRKWYIGPDSPQVCRPPQQTVQGRPLSPEVVVLVDMNESGNAHVSAARPP